MAVTIQSIEANSPAQRAGVLPGEILVAINGHEIYDVLDYRFYETNQRLELFLHNVKGEGRTVSIRKPAV